MRVTLSTDDNFHFMDASKCEECSPFATIEAAVAACREVVDAFLTSQWKAGMTSKELFRGWARFGESPSLGSGDLGCGFSASRYAQERCAQMCRAADEAKKRKQAKEAQRDRWRRVARRPCWSKS